MDWFLRLFFRSFFNYWLFLNWSLLSLFLLRHWVFFDGKLFF
jgi:hypothetical protein